MTGGIVVEPDRGRRLAWLNPKLVVAGVVILIAVGYLMYSGFQTSAASYFVTVGELQAQGAAVDGDRVRVGGNVRPGTIQTGGVDEPLKFEVTDGTASIPVVYEGVLPDIFSDQVEVVVEGTYREGGTFEADTLLTKCPSRFEAEDQSQAAQ